MLHSKNLYSWTESGSFSVRFHSVIFLFYSEQLQLQMQCCHRQADAYSPLLMTSLCWQHLVQEMPVPWSPELHNLTMLLSLSAALRMPSNVLIGFLGTFYLIKRTFGTTEAHVLWFYSQRDGAARQKQQHVNTTQWVTARQSAHGDLVGFWRFFGNCCWRTQTGEGWFNQTSLKPGLHQNSAVLGETLQRRWKASGLLCGQKLNHSSGKENSRRKPQNKLRPFLCPFISFSWRSFVAAAFFHPLNIGSH